MEGYSKNINYNLIRSKFMNTSSKYIRLAKYIFRVRWIEYYYTSIHFGCLLTRFHGYIL